MTKSPELSGKSDRLSAFFRAFDLSVHLGTAPSMHGDATLLVTTGAGNRAVQLVFYARGPAEPEANGAVLVAASVSFGGSANPLVNALPERLVVSLDESPTLDVIAQAFVGEAAQARCGREAALNRLCEVIVLLILRHAIEAGATGPGLLAGLAHPALHRALVRMHDDPARAWQVDDLAALAGMSRSTFMAVFRATLGTTPGAYLTEWRLTLARRALSQGHRIKSVSRRVGFGSAAALSRAYSRKFGHSPIQDLISAHSPNALPNGAGGTRVTT
jgi:AraC-like DNA-binding protein